jgi:hypothetical protein
LSAKRTSATLPGAAVKPLLTILVALVVVLPASAAVKEVGPSIAVVDVPLHGERALSSAHTPSRFDLVGLHWQGAGSVRFRTRRIGGAWSAWHAAAPEAEDRPDRSSSEARGAAGWRLGSPWWVGASDRIEYRLGGRVERLRAYLVSSPREGGAMRTLATADAPPIVPRAGWHADESIRRAEPKYADALRFAVVHHTAGANDYTAEEAPAVVRAIELYHVKGNGWNDIGYNFLVDRFGTVYEGRYGGVDKNVIGAHALGFNTGSVGVALIGTYSSQAPSHAELDSLTRLLAWRLDIAHIDSRSTVSVVSEGSERYRAGVTVQLRTISGHRDTGSTACPGDVLYRRLDQLAADVWSTGLPKIVAPSVTGDVGGLVRFQATLSGSRPWTVTVTDASGLAVASGSGTARTIDWTWDATTAIPGAYTWQIATAGATPATGSLGAAAPPVPATLAISAAKAEPETISPNGDGVDDAATVSYVLTVPASVTINVLDGAAVPVATLTQAEQQPAGEHTVVFTADGLPDARYTVEIDAADATRSVSRTVDVMVTRTLGNVTVAPQAFSPNGDGRADRLAVRFTLLAAASVRVRVLRDGVWVATAFSGTLEAGRRGVYWDGSKRVGRLLDGSYAMVVEATDEVGAASASVPFVSDTRAPAVRILPGRPLRVWVSEPAKLAVRVNGRALSVTATSPGAVRVPWLGPAGRVRAVAWDAAGNVSRPATRS